MAPKRSKKKVETDDALVPVAENEPLAVVPQQEAGTEPLPASEQVILQLPIPASKVDELLHTEALQLVPEYDPNLPEPQPYMAYNKFSSEATELESTIMEPSTPAKKRGGRAARAATEEPVELGTPNRMNCFWCCHPIGHQQFGMPIRYDPIHKNFTLFGTFCSLECASAHNFSVHMGSDRAWEVQSWIQMLARRYNIPEPVRPAPSRLMLQSFQGPMTIDEFRNAHKSMECTYVMNVPPLVSVQAQSECVNSSYIQHSHQPVVVPPPRLFGPLAVGRI